MPSPRATYTVRITEHVFLTKDVMQIRLEKPSDFSYLPGQFVQLVVPGTDGKLTRSYSLSSIPKDPYLEWCIKITPEGVTDTYIQHLRIHDTVDIRGPFGQFTPKLITPLGLVATGVGLAPIIGIIQSRCEQKEVTEPIHLWFGVRTQADIFWIDRLDTLAKQYPHFTYTLTLSQPTDEWTSYRGRVTAHLPTTIDPHRTWFLCGSLEMIKEVRSLLTLAGVSGTHIHQEIF